MSARYIESSSSLFSPSVIFKADEYELLLTSLVNLGYINTNQDKIILESYPRYILCEDFCFEYIDPLYFEEYDLIIEIDGVKLFEYES